MSHLVPTNSFQSLSVLYLWEFHIWKCCLVLRDAEEFVGNYEEFATELQLSSFIAAKNNPGDALLPRVFHFVFHYF
jgi:hypothetical protein